jgi:hypothetical protein
MFALQVSVDVNALLAAERFELPNDLVLTSTRSYSNGNSVSMTYEVSSL